MATHAAELFIQCVYSAELSYDDLHEVEGDLKLVIQQTLEGYDAEYIHFEEMGDTMRVQCVFYSYEENLFHGICDRLAPSMDGRVEARLLFVNKDLDFIHMYTISKGKWHECAVHLPPAGPLTEALRRVDPPGAIQP